MSFLRRNLARALAIVPYMLVALILVLPLLFSNFWLFFLFQMVVVSYVAISFNLVYSYGKLLSFAQGAFFAIGAYSALYLAAETAWSLASAIIVALLASAILGALLGSVFVRMGGHNPTIATVILASASLLAANALAYYTGGEDGIGIKATYVGMAGVAVPTGPNLGLYYAAALPLVAILIGLKLIESTDFWKIVRAIAANETRAQQLGFDVRMRRLCIMSASAAISGLGGVFYALLMQHVSSAVFDIALSVNAILHAVVGGIGTSAGPILGVFVLYPLTEFIAHYFTYVQILVGATLIFVAILFPRGILGTLHDLLERDQQH